MANAQFRAACQQCESGDNPGMFSPLLPRLPVIMLLLLSACSGAHEVRDTRFIMGTLVEFTVAAVDQDQAPQAIAAAAAEMQRVEDEFTIYGVQENAVKRFNAAAPGTPVALPDEVGVLLQLALRVKQQSGGAFDPALGKLNLLWGVSQDPPPAAPPPQAAIAAAIPPARCIERRGQHWLRTDARCLLDFGAIAKGYAIDRGIAVLRAHGVHNAIINAGGDIRLIGDHVGRPWRIGIRHPRQRNEVIASLELQGDVSIVTSGDYERFFINHGRRYHHLLDPKTGMPAGRAQSATVIAASAAVADAWSTALFIQGERGIARQQTLGHLALLIDRSGAPHGSLTGVQ